MLNTNLIQILRTFSKDEMKRFEEMIRSPYFNKHSPVIKLFEHIKKYYPEFKNPVMRKETVYLNMFPEKKFNYGSMKNLIHELQKLCEKFIAIQQFDKNGFEIRRYLAAGLSEKNLMRLGEKNLKDLETGVSGNEMGDDEYFLRLHYINKMKQGQIFGISKSNIHKKEKFRTTYFDNYINSSVYLKKYYLLDTLRTYNRLITSRSLLGTRPAIKHIETFIGLYDEKDFDDLSLKLELHFLKMNLERISDDEFLNLKKIVLEDLYEMKVDKDTIYAYSIYLLNHCRKKNLIDDRYRNHAFDVLKSLVANNNFNDESGYINLILSRNIILIGTRLHEFQWCEHFLQSNLKKIHPDYRDHINNFYFAYKYFNEKKFDRSLEYLSLLDYDDIFNKNYIKELLVMNYFELKYFDLLNEQLESYKKFLSNNEMLPQSYKIHSKNFIEYVLKLHKAASEKKTDLLHLHKKISNEKELLFKDWFLRKLEELDRGERIRN